MLPIVDLASLGEDDGASPTRIGAEVGAACRDVGFFYVVNHGVEARLIAEAFAQSREFFALPLADKRRLAIETVGGNRGYSGLLHEALDPARGPDMKEAFNVGLDLAPDDPELVAGKPFRSLNAWPGCRDFAKRLLAYYEACAALGARLHRAFARDLGLKPDFFADKFDRPMATLRLLTLSRAAPRRRSADGRGRAHGLRQPHAARDRRCRRSRGPHPRRTMDRSAGRPWRLHRQYRRLPDALDQRRLCLNAASSGQSQREGALFDRLFLRPESRTVEHPSCVGGRGVRYRRSWPPI